jgi:hypothetical protein
MAFNWYLFDSMTGVKVRNEPLPVDRSSSKVNIDIHSEDDATIEIPLGELTPTERNNWHGTFREVLTSVVLDNTSIPWDQPGALLFAGFINKLTPKIKPHSVELQLTGWQEYTKARIIGETYGETISDPTLAVYFKANTYQGLIMESFWRMFNNEYLPEIGPKNPQILGNLGPFDGTVRTKDVLRTDAKTYYEFNEEIKNEESGVGLEYRLVPRWTSAERNQYVVDIITGTEEAPHINSEMVVNLVLADNEEAFSSWDTTIDSNDLYSGLFVQSRSGDTTAKSGADLKGAALSAQEFPMLVERFFNPGVELTQEELDAQLQARLAFAGKPKYSAGFTVELQGNPTLWLSRLGATLNIEGVPDTISAGHDAELRCVGISFKPGTGSISVDVMQKQPVYPRLPYKNLGNLFGNNDGALKGGGEKYTYNVQNTSATTLIFTTTDPRVRWAQFTNDAGTVDMSIEFTSEARGTYNSAVPLGSGQVHVTFYGANNEWLGEGSWPLLEFGGATPDTGWSNPGVLDQFDMWGSEGRNPFDGMTKGINDPLFTDFKETTKDYTEWSGDSIIDPNSMCAHEGNRVYGLDTVSSAWGTWVSADGTQTIHENGGFNTTTGEPLSGLKPFYIKQSYLTQDGLLGPVTDAGVFPVEKILAEIKPNYVDISSELAGKEQWYQAGIYKTVWYVNNRIFVGGAWSTWSGEDQAWTRQMKMFWNCKTAYFSAAINGKTGMIEGEWTREGGEMPNHSFPHPRGISRFGTVVTFGKGALTAENELHNASYSDYNYLTKFENGYLLPKPAGYGNNSTNVSFPPKPTAWGKVNSDMGFFAGVSPVEGGNLSCDFKNSTEIFKKFRNTANPQSQQENGGYPTLETAAILGLLIAGGLGQQPGAMAIKCEEGGISSDEHWKDISLMEGEYGDFCLGVIRENVFVQDRNSTWMIKIDPDTKESVRSKQITQPEHKDFCWRYDPWDSTANLYLPVDVFLREMTQYAQYYTRQSRIFSYGGRLFVLKLEDVEGVQRITTRSMKIIEDPAPTTP